MSRENVEIVRGAIPAAADLAEPLANAGAREVATQMGFDLDAFTDDAEVLFIGSWRGIPARRYRGIAGLIEGWRDWLEPYASYELELEELIDGGEKVVSFVHVKAITARDRVPIEHRPAAVWTVRDSKIARAEFHLERDQALAAAGLD
jgi:ketosteroid isomerase-like protein